MLVDVRHEASHNELPSLALLRLAASEALTWLRASYWQRQADHLAACRAHISTLLKVRRDPTRGRAPASQYACGHIRYLDS